jgi:IS30 family transposase
MTKYKRLTLEEREKIHALVNQGKSNREISAELERSHTTISRELRRCGTKFEYSPSKAQTNAGGKAPLRERGNKTSTLVNKKKVTNIVFDTSGVRIYEAGEWKKEKYGGHRK